MNCDFPRTALHGYLDGELDAARSAEFERHLEICRECANSLATEESLRSALQHAGLYDHTPAVLRKKIRAELQALANVPAAQRIPTWRWLAVAAAILIVTGVSWYAWPRLGPTPPSAGFTAAEMIDAHVRSLQPGHLMDIASTDQHTVKPWFSGKLDYSPPVKDYSDEGFPLIGGRLDSLAGRNIAVLVYARRKHIINVFVLPTKEPDTQIHPPGLRQGYQWFHWRRQGMEYCAVSDVSVSDLHELAQLLYQ